MFVQINLNTAVHTFHWVWVYVKKPKLKCPNGIYHFAEMFNFTIITNLANVT